MSPRPYDGAKRRADADQTRERILAAAAEMLSSPEERGRFSLDAVAKRAGVARMTVYYQFASRGGLLEAVFDHRAAQSRIMELPAAMAEPDPREALRRLVSVFCDFWGVDVGAMIGLNLAAGLDPEIEESLRSRNERRRGALRSLAVRMQAARPDDLVDALFVLTSAATYTELTRGRDLASTETLIQDLAAAAVERFS